MVFVCRVQAFGKEGLTPKDPVYAAFCTGLIPSKRMVQVVSRFHFAKMTHQSSKESVQAGYLRLPKKDQVLSYKYALDEFMVTVGPDTYVMRYADEHNHSIEVLRIVVKDNGVIFTNITTQVYRVLLVDLINVPQFADNSEWVFVSPTTEDGKEANGKEEDVDNNNATPRSTVVTDLDSEDPSERPLGLAASSYFPLGDNKGFIEDVSLDTRTNLMRELIYTIQQKTLQKRIVSAGNPEEFRHDPPTPPPRPPTPEIYEDGDEDDEDDEDDDEDYVPSEEDIPSEEDAESLLDSLATSMQSLDSFESSVLSSSSTSSESSSESSLSTSSSFRSNPSSPSAPGRACALPTLREGFPRTPSGTEATEPIGSPVRARVVPPARNYPRRLFRL